MIASGSLTVGSIGVAVAWSDGGEAKDEHMYARLDHTYGDGSITAADVDLTVFAALNAARVLDVSAVPVHARRSRRADPVTDASGSLPVPHGTSADISSRTAGRLLAPHADPPRATRRMPT